MQRKQLWIAFWNILLKDIRAYYFKPPNISWGLIFPLAWAAMFFIREEGTIDVLALLPGVVALSILFGATSLLAVTVTFEKKGRSFERLLLAPIPLELLMFAKTAGAIIFGTLNAFVPIILALFFTDLSGVAWASSIVSIILISACCTFMMLLIAVSVSEVFEAQTFSNFFRFPMIFLCGLFIPVSSLPYFLQPVSFALPPTYGVDILHWSFLGQSTMLPVALNFGILLAFCAVLFIFSLRNVKMRWIV